MQGRIRFLKGVAKMTKPLHWVVDDDGYPTRKSLRSLRRFLNSLSVTDAGTWLVRGFPALVQTVRCGHVDVRENVQNPVGGTVCVVEYSTGGWSGQEDLVQEVLKSPYLKLFYHTAWRKGGHYTFEVPMHQLKPRISG